MCKRTSTAGHKMPSDFVSFVLDQLIARRKVAIQCSSGGRRTGLAIYALLRCLKQKPEESLAMLKEMCPETHAEFVQGQSVLKAEIEYTGIYVQGSELCVGYN